MIYEAGAVDEAKRANLLKIALGEVEAYTSTATWDEVVWIVRKLYGFELSLEQSKL